jgi:carbamoyl-phosphate synthase large subunit
MARKEPLTVLVLGVGGNIGQGILKALARSPLRCRILGACISPLAMGLYTVDKSFVSPSAAEPAFADWLFTVCREEHVDAVLCGVEPVLDALGDMRDALQRDCGTLCVVSDAGTLEIGRDKLATCRWLQAEGLQFPQYALTNDETGLERLLARCPFPLIAKPRFGRSSEGVMYLSNAADVQFLRQRQDYLVQECLGTPRDEFTAGTFVDRHGAVRGTIVMRRELQSGTTYRAELGMFPDVRDEAMRIAAALRPMGPCNMQFRLTDRGPVCFEINVRFSGTTPLRAFFGYNEVDAALRHFVLDVPLEDLPLVTSGIGLRYWNELYVAPEAGAALRDSGVLTDPHAFPTTVEDYGMQA